MGIDLSECEEIEASDISLSEICGLMENLICFENTDRENIEDWFNFDSNDPGFQIMNVADIVSNITQTEERECDNDSENTSEEDTDNHISRKANSYIDPFRQKFLYPSFCCHHTRIRPNIVKGMESHYSKVH